MIFGGVDKEQIQLNEDTLWTGDENPTGDYGTMRGYQTLGNLFIELTGHSPANHYRRELNKDRPEGGRTPHQQASGGLPEGTLPRSRNASPLAQFSINSNIFSAYRPFSSTTQILRYSIGWP